MGTGVLNRRVVAVFALVMLVSSGVQALNLPLVPTNAVASITPRELRTHLSFLASKELGGRYTFSPGNRIAARYLASQLESYGYRGAAKDGGYLQRINFSSSTLDRKNTRLEVMNSTADSGAGAGNSEQKITSREFIFGEHFYSFDPLAIDIKSDVVFVGYGISSPSRGYDDYAGLDLEGKIALIVVGTPKVLQGKVIKPEERTLAAARSHGAKAALLIHEQYSQSGWESFGITDDESLKMQGETGAEQGIPELPNVFIGPAPVDALLGSTNLNFDQLLKLMETGEPLKPCVLSVPARLNIAMREIKEQAQNVVAIFEGSDPRLKNEYVMLSAHYDHLKSSGDTVYYGADDDGSGTAAVLVIARAFATGPRPKRSILVVFHTAEELGLHGSRFFTNIEPLVPLGSIIVDLNIDMIGRSRPAGSPIALDQGLTDKDSLYIIGSDKHSSELHHINEQTNQELTRMRLDYSYGEESHPLKLYYRSDHYNYALKGIPVIFYFTGLHSDYHRPTDTVDKIDFEKAARITRLIYGTAWRLANLDHRLAIDRWKKN
jgi:hypothetical protein